MEVDFLVVFTSLVGLFLIMGVGFLSVKTNVIPGTITQNLSNILLKVSLPATVFYSVVSKEYDPAFFKEGLTAMGLCLVIYLAEAGVALILAKYVFHVQKGGQGVWAMTCTFCNNAFIGYPIIQALLGTDALALAAMYGLTINVLTYSLGIWLIAKDSRGEGKEKGKAEKIGARTILFNNLNIALIIGLIFFFGRIPVPNFIMVPVTHFGNMTTPLSMFTTGAIMASSTIGNMFKDKDVYFAALVRLLLFPVLIITALKMTPVAHSLVYYMVCVTMMMPSPAVSTILCDLYGGNRNLASKVVLFSSIVCLVTIPLMTMLM